MAVIIKVRGLGLARKQPRQYRLTVCVCGPEQIGKLRLTVNGRIAFPTELKPQRFTHLSINSALWLAGVGILPPHTDIYFKYP